MFLFEQRAVQDHSVAPLFRTCPGTREATSKARQQQQPQPSRTPPTKGVYVACVPASVRHACLFRCRLLQRGLHDAVWLLVSCLLVFVLHACSCLSRNLPRGHGGWLEQPRYLQDQVELEGPTGRGGNQRELGPPFNCLPWLDSALLGPRGWSSVGVPLPAPQALVTSPSPAAWPLKLGLWTGLFVCSYAWGFILAGCM